MTGSSSRVPTEKHNDVRLMQSHGSGVSSTHLPFSTQFIEPVTLEGSEEMSVSYHHNLKVSYLFVTIHSDPASNLNMLMRREIAA